MFGANILLNFIQCLGGKLLDLSAQRTYNMMMLLVGNYRLIMLMRLSEV
jgi:hypothetical protein